ncbi:MAG: TfoX/Sxy family protein [Verrucomicrobiales bacterium]|nr:TfoX/Sxy family protein [Verrucomicrobiales bacterium]
MAYDESLAERVRAALWQSGTTFEEKAMMGGLCILVDGKMCVGVVQDRLMARLDPAIYEEMLERPGCEPMDFTGRPMKGYVWVDPPGMKGDAALQHWIGLALEFNPRAKASKSRKKSG